MSPEVVEPRRRDRGEDEAWIRDYLAGAPVGTLAVPLDDGPPHLNSNLFAFDGEGPTIWVHTARTGALREALSRVRTVSFTAFDMGRLLPADEALEFSVEYRAVVVRGSGRLVSSPEEKEAGLQRILEKYAPHLRPGEDYRPIVDEELTRTAVYRIDVEAWSGKEKRAAADFPGAYRYEEIAAR